MCKACIKDYPWRLNPEPSSVALARYMHHVEQGTVPKKLPKWLTAHLRANYAAPFRPDFRQVLPNPCTRKVPEALIIPEKSAEHSLSAYISRFDDLNYLRGVPYRPAGNAEA